MPCARHWRGDEFDMTPPVVDLDGTMVDTLGDLPKP